MGLFKSITKAVKDVGKTVLDYNKAVVGTIAPALDAAVPGMGKIATAGVALQDSLYGTKNVSIQNVATNAMAVDAATGGTASTYIKNGIKNAAQSLGLPSGTSVPVIPSQMKPGILGTKLSTGNETVDQIIGGAVGGVAESLLGQNKTIKDISNKAINQTAANWLKDNWYIVAGVIVGLMVLLRGRR